MPFESRLIRKEVIAEGTMTFYFEKPEGFEFEAGQSLDLTLTEATDIDPSDATRSFSIASAPQEREILIATRLRDTQFKKSFADMEEDTEVVIDGPFGEFQLSDPLRRAVFLAGGIGITPFRSLIIDAIVREMPHRIALFYSNRTPEDAAFLAELTDLAESHPGLLFVPTMTDANNSAYDWDGETGHIDATLLNQYLPTRNDATYYLCGSQSFTSSMRRILEAEGVDSENILQEDMVGY